MKNRKLLNLLLSSTILISFCAQPSQSATKNRLSQNKQVSSQGPELDRAYIQKILDNVDKKIVKSIYSEKLATEVWPKSLAENKEKILASKTLVELQERMTAALAPLNSSHLNFVTKNDPMMFYLMALFGDIQRVSRDLKENYTGFVTGGAGFAHNRVRYVVDNSPAAKAGICIGDIILRVDNEPYSGLLNFKAKNKQTIEIEREGHKQKVSLTPILANYYDEYNQALEKSATILNEGGKKIGYVHVWGGGAPTHDLFDIVLSHKLHSADGLILDMRDGYGGNSLDDLDRFFRKSENYPDFVAITRRGKKQVIRYVFDKPVVALINKGSRSGKEILAYTLKKTKRAKLVGDTTGGAVLGGSFHYIDPNCALYLPIIDVKIDGVRIEGVGVEPDVHLENKDKTQAGYDKQLNEAKRILLDEIESKQTNQTQEKAAG
ncbi:MAG: hypothetical protein IPG59_17300 [Candidatus Melainabacteria bacterium]|nr:MAG: hypothetical protein IPG59_17300 [Candidatus Melainabacteria bacterium]